MLDGRTIRITYLDAQGNEHDDGPYELDEINIVKEGLKVAGNTNIKHYVRYEDVVDTSLWTDDDLEGGC